MCAQATIGLQITGAYVSFIFDSFILNVEHGLKTHNIMMCSKDHEYTFNIFIYFVA